MLLIDENISEIEIWRLREWRITVRVIGEEIAEKSISDENILAILHRLKQPTFFTKDRDFYKPALCHPAYALVYMDVPEHEGQVAGYIRRFLRHPEFDATAKRLGKVIHVHVASVKFWKAGTRTTNVVKW